MIDQLRAMNPPDAEWLSRLRAGHFIYAVKEARFCQVQWAWEPPDPGSAVGRMSICFCWSNGENEWGREPFARTWYVRQDGTGIDGSQLLLPVEGNCPEIAADISDVWIRHTERALARLLQRVDQLEAEVRRLATRLGIDDPLQTPTPETEDP